MSKLTRKIENAVLFVCVMGIGVGFYIMGQCQGGLGCVAVAFAVIIPIIVLGFFLGIFKRIAIKKILLALLVLLVVVVSAIITLMIVSHKEYTRKCEYDIVNMKKAIEEFPNVYPYRLYPFKQLFTKHSVVAYKQELKKYEERGTAKCIFEGVLEQYYTDSMEGLVIYIGMPMTITFIIGRGIRYLIDRRRRKKDLSKYVTL